MDGDASRAEACAMVRWQMSSSCWAAALAASCAGNNLSVNQGSQSAIKAKRYMGEIKGAPPHLSRQ